MNIKTIPERRDIRQKDRWDPTPLFASDSEWEAVFAEVTKDIARVSTYRDRLPESLEVLKEAIDCYLDLMRRLERLYTYARLKSDENRSNQRYLALNQKALHLLTRFSEQASFLTPQIQSLPKDVVERCLKANPLIEYRFFLEKILRFKPHTRTEAEERILAMSRALRNACQTRGELAEARSISGRD